MPRTVAADGQQDLGVASSLSGNVFSCGNRLRKATVTLVGRGSVSQGSPQASQLGDPFSYASKGDVIRTYIKEIAGPHTSRPVEQILCLH